MLCGLSAELEAAGPDDIAGAAGARTTIDLSRHDADTLQRAFDSLAIRPCPLPSNAACGWRVLSVSRASAGPASPPVDAAPARRSVPPSSTADVPTDVSAGAPTGEPSRARDGRRFSSAVPAGFESLAARRDAVLDVRIDGVVRAYAVPVSHDDATLRFEDPVAVAGSLAPFVAAEPARFEDFVASDHPLEVDESCFDRRGPRDCATRGPTDFAFVPELDAGTATLVLRDGMGVATRAAPRRLAGATAAPSLQASARASSVMLSGRDPANDVALGASASYGEGGLFGAASWSDTTNAGRLDELYFAHQFDDHRLRVGTLERRGSAFLTNPPLVGIDVSRSFATLVDRETLFAVPVELELDERSVVQLVVDGTVRDSQTLDAGLVEVATDALPLGTYELEIRVRSPGGGLRVERRIHTRTRVLPPPRTPEYGLAVGSPRVDAAPGLVVGADGAFVPDPLGAGAADPLATSGRTLLSGRVTTRLSPRLGLELQGSNLDGANLAEARLIGLGRRWQAELGGAAGDGAAIGASLRAAWQGRSVGLSLDALGFESERDAPGADPVLADFLRPDVRRAGVGASLSRGRWTLGLRADRIELPAEADVRERFSATLRRRIGSGAFAGGSIRARYVDDGDAYRAELRLEVVARERRLRHRAYTGVGHRAGGDWAPEIGYSATLAPESAARSALPRRWGVRAEGVAREDRGRIGVGLELVDRFVDLGLAADAIDHRDGELDWRALATVATQVASDGGSPAAGRPRGHDAGIIVDVDGTAAGEPFDIVVDGLHRGVGRVGTRQFVGLPAFRTHEVLLVPRSLASNGLDGAPETVTLYPGNVHRVDVDAERRYLLVTRLVGVDGTELTNVAVDGAAERFFVRDDGILQVEVRSLDVLDVDLGDGERCAVDVPDPGGRELVVEAVPLVCL